MAWIIYPALQAPVLTAAQEPEAVSVDRWLIALSEPVRVKPRLPEPSQQFFFFQPTPIISIGWFSALSEPVRVKPRLPEPSQQPFFSQPFPVVSFSWFNWLSDPVRVPLRLREGDQQFLALVKAAPFPESVTIDRWLLPLSEPIRLNLLRGIAAPYQQVLAIDPRALLLKEAIFEDKWHQPWSEPVRFRILPAWKIAIDSASGGVLGIDPSTFPIPVPPSIRRPLFYQSAGAIWKGRSSG